MIWLDLMALVLIVTTGVALAGLFHKIPRKQPLSPSRESLAKILAQSRARAPAQPSNRPTSPQVPPKDSRRGAPALPPKGVKSGPAAESVSAADYFHAAAGALPPDDVKSK